MLKPKKVTTEIIDMVKTNSGKYIILVIKIDINKKIPIVISAAFNFKFMF